MDNSSPDHESCGASGPAPAAPDGPCTGSTPSVLVVDDTSSIRRLMINILRKGGYDADEAEGAPEARRALERRPYDAILIDAKMPGESGFSLLGHVRAAYDTAPVMVTALEDEDLIESAFAAGAFGYVVKPFRPRELLINVTNALHRREQEINHRSYVADLEATVEERTQALNRALAPLPGDADVMVVSVEELIGDLSRAVTVRDEETGEHILRMSSYSALLADHAGIDIDPKRVRLAAALHDVGKIGVPDAVLLKPGRLTPEEFQTMQRHTTIGHDMLAVSNSSLLRLGATIALTHHERWDGSGYPNRLAGPDIPILGRVAAVADVFDALTSDRVYRRAMQLDQALEIMREGRGTHFDPELLDLFLARLDDVLTLRDTHRDRAA